MKRFVMPISAVITEADNRGPAEKQSHKTDDSVWELASPGRDVGALPAARNAFPRFGFDRVASQRSFWQCPLFSIQ